jgi:hypothetical protein
MKKFKLYRWAYFVIIIVASVMTALVASFATDTGWAIGLLVTLLLPMLTYPLGVVGTLIAFPLIYTGLATVSEGYLFAAPFYAAAGTYQWYVLFPRIFSRRLQDKPEVPPGSSH